MRANKYLLVDRKINSLTNDLLRTGRLTRRRRVLTRFVCVDSYWKRNISGASTLHANVDKTAADSLRAVAKIMLSRFKQLWTQYSERNTLRAEQRRPFYCGLYDGMMQSPRSPGEKVPMFSGPRRKKKKEKKELVFSVENHPYEIGIALGGMIRANSPLRTLSYQLRIMMQPQSGT